MFDARDLYKPSYGLYAASDAAFGDNHSRVSTAGYVVFLGGGLVMWKSRKQPYVTLSTAKAEFINLTPTGVALLWTKKLLR
ncbi:Ty1/Copia family ribonuclease HI [Candidatus Bathyarchaeota archaeon]|nr:Ty1/Copia family ribonuclease HI [Candidatus Bathyarchaeota archaeon]